MLVMLRRRVGLFDGGWVGFAADVGVGGNTNGMNGHAITLEEVQEIAKECKIDFKPGDIFFLRCGFTKTWESISLDEKMEYRKSTQAHKHKHTGLIQSEAVCKFMWDNHIVAVAGKLKRIQLETSFADF